MSEFRCANGEKCIAEFQKCNHRKDCTDGSDEEDCSKFEKQMLFNQNTNWFSVSVPKLCRTFGFQKSSILSNFYQKPFCPFFCLSKVL